MHIEVIAAPYHMGQGHTGPGNGPDRYLQGGLVERLAGRGLAVSVQRVLRDTPIDRDELANIRAVNAAVAAQVQAAQHAGRFPLVLAGNCNTALGTVTGIGQPDIGIVWFDAHGDYNTPQTTLSGYFEGMPLAIINGQCDDSFRAEAGNPALIPAENTVLVGVRDLDPPEKELLDSSAVTVIPSGDGLDALEGALDDLQGRVKSIYLHLDIDVLRGAEAPGVDYPSPGGMTRAEVVQALHMIRQRFDLAAVGTASFNPARDRENLTVESGLALIEAALGG